MGSVGGVQSMSEEGSVNVPVAHPAAGGRRTGLM